MGISEEIVNRIKSNIKVHNDGISVHEPSFLNSNASKYLCECIDSGWVSSSGKWVTKFEELIHEFTGSKYVVVVSNGTNALKLSLYMVGVVQMMRFLSRL